MEENKEEKKKKIKKGILATITSASVLIGGTFDTPEDILEPLEKPIKPVSEVMDYNQDLFEDLYKKENPKDAFKNLSEAVDKYKDAVGLAKEIEKDLDGLKNEIEVLAKDFSK